MRQHRDQIDFNASLALHLLAPFPYAAVFVLDRQNRCRYFAGPGLAERRSGAPPTIGCTLDELLPDEQATALRPALERAFAGDVADAEVEVGGKTLAVHAAPLDRDAGVSMILAVMNDVTAVRAMQTRVWLMEAAGEILASSLDIDTTLSAVAHLLVPRLADWCSIHLVTTGGGIRRVAFTTADSSKAALMRELAEYDKLRRDGKLGPAAVVRTGVTEFHPKATDELLAEIAVDERHLALLREIGLAASIIAPMTSHGRVLGTISVSLAAPHRAYLEETRILVEDLARRAALAVQSAKLYRAVRQELARREREQEGERLRFGALDRLSKSNVVGIVTVKQGWIVEANDTFLRLVGYEASDVRHGRLNWRAITPSEYAPLDDHTLNELLATGSSTPVEKEFIRRDGTRVRILTGAALIDRDPMRWVGIVVDLSARHAFEDAHQAFMEDIGHDLRSPISVIRWAAQLMRQSLKARRLDRENLDHWLGTIETSTVRMALLIDGLMDAARLRLGQTLELHLEPTDFGEIVERLATGYRYTSYRHKITVGLPEERLVGMWDQSRLERILDNLLSNAIKYSPGGGEVVVSLATEQGPDGPWAVLTVRDQGIGIDEVELTTIFNRFRRGAEAAAQMPGSGIGLAGVKQMVEELGGNIEVESRIGKGSSFTIRLPVRPVDQPVSEGGDPQPVLGHPEP